MIDRDLVVHAELTRQGHDGFSFLAFTPFGLPILILAIIYMLVLRLFLAPGLAPERAARPRSTVGDQTPEGFALHLTIAIARTVSGDEGSARRAIAQTWPKGANQLPVPVAVG